MEQLTLDKFPCEICKELCINKCAKCFKVSYCGKEHQITDWVTHKSTCRRYPVEMRKNENSNSPVKMICATKLIKKGHLIMKERSLISGPHLNELKEPNLNNQPEDVCLSCYKKMSTPDSYSCSNCQWPVCDLDCEKEKVHADFECKIFADNSIKPLPMKNEITGEEIDVYSMIVTLRALLLREIDPQKWQLLLNIYSYPSLRDINVTPYAHRKTHENLTIDFIQNTCKLSEIDTHTIKHVMGIVEFNCRGNNVLDHQRGRHKFMPISPRICSYLFHDLSCISKSFDSNIIINQKYVNNSEIEVEIYASRTIQRGEPLKQVLTEDDNKDLVTGQIRYFESSGKLPSSNGYDINPAVVHMMLQETFKIAGLNNVDIVNRGDRLSFVPTDLDSN